MQSMHSELHAPKRTRRWYAGAVVFMMGAAISLAACNPGGDQVVDPNAPAATTPAAGATSSSGSTGGTGTTATGTPEAGAGSAVTDTTGSGATGGTGSTATGTPEAGATGEITGTEGTTGTGTGGAATTPTVTAGGDITATEGTTGTQGMNQMPGTNAGMRGVQGAPDQFVRASKLLDYSFENIDGEVSGDIEDLMVDLSNGRILFASIEYGGILDLGDKDIVVPMSAFAINEEGGLVLNFDETSLEQYPEVADNWPDVQDPAWDDEVNNFWNSIGIQSNEDLTTASQTIGWISDILGNQVQDAGFGAGAIVDVLVNLGTGQAKYALVDYGAGLGAGDNAGAYVMPLSAFDMTNRDNGLVLAPNVTQDTIQGAPRFDPAQYDDDEGIDAGFSTDVDSWWNEHGFDTNMGDEG